MRSFNIFFSDLNDDAKARFLEFAGMDDPKDGNYDIDILPIATVDMEDEAAYDGNISVSETYEAIELYRHIDGNNFEDECIRAIRIDGLRCSHADLIEKLHNIGFEKPLYVYDVRHDDAGNIATIEPLRVMVNRECTIVTNINIDMPCRYVTCSDTVECEGQYDYLYAITGEEFYPSDFENYLYDEFESDDDDLLEDD